jgi:ubiquinone/menaquinone biosynthesis C-methylase UbiE
MEPASHASPAGPHRRFFDLWARVYDLPWVQRLTYRPEHEAVLRRLGALGPRRVLDLGCGTGILAARTQGLLPGATVVGCDFSRGMLARAAARGPALRWVQGDALRLPFASGAFDAAVSTEAFHWFPDPHAALRELHRVLARRGRLLVALVNPPAEWISRATHEASRLAGEPFDWPTRARMRERVEAAGFRVEEQARILRLPVPFLLPTVLTVATRG